MKVVFFCFFFLFTFSFFFPPSVYSWCKEKGDDGKEVAPWLSSSVPVHYRINSGFLSSVAGAADRVRAAFLTWQNSGAGISFTDLGATAVSATANDGIHAIWSSAEAVGGNLAVTYYWYNAQTREIMDADMWFDNAEGWTVSCSTAAGVTVQGVAAHEIGHFIGLDHPNDCGQSVLAVMNTPYGVNGSASCSLYDDDKTGGKTLYPPAAGGAVAALHPTGPNPFRPRLAGDYAAVSFGVNQSGSVTVEIYNLAGERVKVLADQSYDAGSYTGSNGLKWYGDDGSPGQTGNPVGSGVYLVVLKLNGQTQAMRKMMLIR